MSRLPAMSIKPNWKKPQYVSSLQLPAKVRQWLLYPDSMTQQLRKMSALFKQELTIKLVDEQLEILPGSDAMDALFPCRWVYSRETQLFAGSTLLMYAKSLIPKDQNSLWKRMFRNLGQQPLGQILFSDANFKRSDFEIAKIFPKTTEYNLVTFANKLEPEFIWARRSFFYEHIPCLLLTEYFSPTLFTMMNEVL